MRVNERLDLFLQKTLGCSRSQAQRAIKEGRVRVGGEVILQAKQPVSANDQIDVEPIVRLASPKLIPTIIYEDYDVLVIDKPSGLLTHATQESDHRETVVRFVLEHCPHISTVGEHPLRPGIVHRIDREASGLIAVAKHQESFLALKQAFQERVVDKTYIALCHGKSAEHTTIVNPIGRGDDGKMHAFPFGSHLGKLAETTVTCLRTFDHHSLVQVRILTGRTHQIRVHLSSRQHPLVGDRLYGKRDDGGTRLFLHAHELGIPIGASRALHRFVSPLPPELISTLREV